MIAPLFCVFLSGIAALIDEVVWTSLLALTFGGTRLASGAVLAGFLGGMGLGAWLLPRLFLRARPGHVYAWLEGGIAVSSVALTLALPKLPQLLLPITDPLVGIGAPLDLIRFGAAALLLLVPSALMGATLPVLVSALATDESTFRRRLGALYGVNTLGAAVGALLAGILLIEWVGHRRAVFIAAALNVIAGSCFLGAQRARPAPAPVLAASTPSTPFPRSIAAITLVVAGATTLGYEILWFRVFSYLFGSSTYAFCVMLFAFLAGLGIGPLLLRRVVARSAPERALATIQLGIGILALAAIAIMTYAIESSPLRREISVFEHVALIRPWGERLLRDGAFALAVTAPATILMGLSFPLAASLYVRGDPRLAPRLGGAILLSNLGSIAGAIGGSLALLPAFGTIGGTRAVALANLGLGMLLHSCSAGSWKARLGPVLGAVVIAAALWIASPERIRFTAAVPESSKVDLAFEKEGDLATVQVWRSRLDPRSAAMSIDGTIIGASKRWGTETYTKQVLIAHLPFALDDRIRDVLTVGLGCGSTLESIAIHPNVQSIDVVEINAPVIRAARLFESGRALDDHRVRVVLDDAVHFLRRTKKTYDAIISDGKCSMSHCGTSRLLTREYYDLCRSRLNEHGLFVQWIPTGIADEEVRTIIRTLLRSYEEVGLFFDSPNHLLFVASRSSFTGRGRVDRTTFDASAAAGELSGIGVEGWDGLVGRWVAGSGALGRAAGKGAENTWDSPKLEFTAYKLPVERRLVERAKTMTLAGVAAEYEQEARPPPEVADPAKSRP